MTSPPAEPPRPGSQPERTRLAWRRTALALLASALLAIAVVARRRGGVAGVSTLVPVLVVAGAGLTLADRRARALDRPGYGRLNWAAPALALLIAAQAVLAIVLVLVTAG